MSFQDHVIKRNGEKEILSFDKILNRVIVLGEDCNSENELNINYTSLVRKIIDRLYDGIPTGKIDELTAQQCASLITTHPDYNKLASRILVSNHHKNTDENYLNIVSKLYNFKDIHGKNSPLVSKELFDLVVKNKDEIQSFFDFDRDYLVDYFGFKTLERAYLQRMGTNIVERPQHMWMRVSLAIHKDDLVKVKQTYDLMSQKFFTHATPTLFNAGTPRQQMSSCYLLAMKDDSISGIYETLTDCASISKWAGGIGLHIHNVRASGSHIRGTNGTSNGIVPMLRVFNNTARYVDQCVLPETIIYTTNGPMEIQYCTTENNVFTTGGYEKIQNVLEHSYSGEILHIKSIHSFKELSITPEHPVYCLKNQKKGVNYSTIKNRIAKEIIKPEWIDAKDLTLEDMLIFTKPKYEKDVISISEDDCYMYGLLLGDGSMNNTSTSCYISLHSTNKLNNLTFIKNYLADNCIQYFINTENNTSRIRWNKSMNLPFRYGTLYGENKEKVIHTSWLNLPIKKIKYIVKGLIDSDGCVAGEVVFDTTSLKLVEGLRYLLLRMGIPTGGYIRDRRGEKHISKYGDEIENKKISYCLRIPKTDSIANLLLIEKGTFHKFFEHDNLIYTRISNIEKGNYEGTLYDLQLEKTHNYMIHNGVVHNGGGKRNGSFAIYLEPWHGDIREFLDMKKTHGDEEQRARDLFYALWIPDLFMKRVSKGAKWTLMCPDKCPGLSDVYGAEFEALYTKYENEGRGEVVQARDIWFKILDSQIETGTPYMLYKDACNKKSNQKNLGTIKSSNLCCVKGDTLLLTDKGHLPIQTLEDKMVNVWNGKEFSTVEVKQTNDSAELLTIEFSDGSELTCTKYHKFYIQTKYPNKMKQDVLKSKSVEIIEAQNLKCNMKLIKCDYPVIDNKEDLISSYTNGFFSGDGTYSNQTDNNEKKCEFQSLKGKSYCKRHIMYQRNDEDSKKCCGISYAKKHMVSLYGDKIKLLEYLDYRSTGIEKNNKLNVTLSVDIKDKFFVPMNYSLKSKLDWFAGYCDADGCIARNDSNQSLQISCIHRDFLLNIKLMLQTCGVASKVTLNMAKRLSYLPNGKGGMKYYESKELWRLLVGSNDLQKLVELGFSPKRLVIVKHIPQRNATQFVKVSKITDNGEVDKTFCFTEKKRHAGIFNGVITSQCEIIEFSDPEETAVCNLASIGLPKFVTTPHIKYDNLIIYSKPNCNYCKMAKNLISKTITTNVVEIIVDDENRDAFKSKFSSEFGKDVKTLPQIIIDGKYIGGYTELLEIHRATFDYEKLHDVVKIVTENLNKVIDINYYPTPKTEKSNSKHRPIGLGVQGLADVFMLMDLPFECDESKKINRLIFETIYHAAVESSMELSLKNGPYSSFEGSPASQGLLSFDMWEKKTLSGRYDWEDLKERVKKNGLRNSLLIAPMPTASTSQILGNNECFEPYTSNIYLRRTVAGEFVMVNKHLLKELVELDLWNDDIKNKIIADNGSVQNIPDLPKCIKEKYKIVWEMPMKNIITMCADRAPFVDQSMSMNLWMENPTYKTLTAMHFFSFEQGLKTGLYYLRTKAKAAPQKFTIDPDAKPVEDDQDCLMCGA
jgi:ribonucleoside-diphosphate reductase alpha chain